MSDKLIDAAKDKWAIIEERPDASALRNDGQELRSRHKNQWYVLATLYGEQGKKFDRDLAAGNRRARNLWACQGLDAAARTALAEKMGLTEDELGGAWETERPEIERRFRERMGEGADLPDPEMDVDLNQVYFAKDTEISFSKCHFAAITNFNSAHFLVSANFFSAHFASRSYFSNAYFNSANFKSTYFAGSTEFLSAHFASSEFSSAHFADFADFSSSHFGGPASFNLIHCASDAFFLSARFAGSANFASAQFGGAYFRTAHFTAHANFTSTQFSGLTDFCAAHFTSAIFRNGHFASNADFSSARFAGSTHFSSAHFDAAADFTSADFTSAHFSSAHFANIADFSSAVFKRATRFEDAIFETRAPRFLAAEVYQDTTFTLDEDNWPKPDLKDSKTAKEDADAYIRLKQWMADAHKPDDAHFFLRRELRCKLLTEKKRERVWIWLFWKLSDFGYSIWRPFRWLARLWAVGSIYFFFSRGQAAFGTSGSVRPSVTARRRWRRWMQRASRFPTSSPSSGSTGCSCRMYSTGRHAWHWRSRACKPSSASSSCSSSASACVTGSG